MTRAEKNKNSFFDSVSKTFENVKLENLGEAVEFIKHAGISAGVRFLISGIKFWARVPGEEFLIVADKFDEDTEKLSAILGNKFVYIPILQAEKFETVEKILGCAVSVVKFSLDDKDPEKFAMLILPEEKLKVSDTKFALAQQIAEIPIMMRR